MKCGDVIWTALPEGGIHVQAGARPCIILGNNAACKFSDVVTVIPLSTRIYKSDKIPSHVTIGLQQKSIALTEQIRTVNKSCLLGSPIYRLSEEEMESLKKALKSQLKI